MAIDLEKMRVVIETDTSNFKKEVNEVKKEAHKAAEAADKELGSIGGKGGNTIKDRIKAIRTVVKSLAGAVKLDGGLLKPTEAFSALEKQIDESTKKIEVLKRTLEKLKAKGFSGDETAAQIAQEEAKRDAMMQQAQSMFDESMANGGVGPAFEANTSLSKIEAIKGAIQGLKSVARGAFQGFADAHPVLAKVLSTTGKVASVIGRIGITAGKAAFAGVKKLAGGIKNLFSHAKGAGSRGLLGGLARMIAGLYLARRALMFVINGIKQGMNNLAQYSKSTNGSLSMLQSSLTQCKNALATAFAPVLNAVAPLLNTLINWVTAAATALAHFFSALTGQKQTTIALKVNQNYAEGLNNAANSANDAADATEKYQRTLMGFDKINKLEDKSGSGSGSGGSGGGLSPSDMFDTVDVSSSAIDWANKFKEAWENADFTEIGRTVAAKLKSALESIPWEQIQATAGKIGKSIATFLNGLFEDNSVWYTVGNTFAQALNTIIEFGYQFVTNFDWASFGEAIGSAINGVFENVNFSKAAKGFSDAIKGLLETGIAAVETINWEKIGEDLADLLINVDWVGIAKKAIEFLAKALIGAIKGLDSFVNKIGETLTEYFKSGQWLEDLKDIGALTLDLSLNIIGEAWTLLCSIIGAVLNITAEIVGKTVGEVWKWIGSKISGVIEYTAKKIGGVWSAIKTSISGVVTYASKKARNWLKGIYTKLSGAVTYASKKASGWLKNISRKLTGTVTFAANWAKGALQALQRAASKAGSDKFFTWGFRGKSPGKRAEGGVYKNGSWQPVTAAANGGSFDQGQMFVAREAGPELVGTIGNHTAVVNNDQIVASVSDGVAKAVASVMSSRGGGQVNITLQGDAGRLFRIMQQQANSYTRSTGKAAFPV